MAFNVGAITATLGFRVDDDGATKFDRRLRTLREDVKKPVEAELRGDLNSRDLDLYERKLKDIRAQVSRRDQFKAALGADYDPRAFRAYERDLRKSEKATDDNIKAQGRLRTAFGTVYGRGGAIFAAAGGLYALQAAGRAVITTATDINESLTKNESLFGRYARTTDRWSKSTATSLGVSRQAALAAAGSFGSLFETIGTADKPAAQMSRRLVQLASDLASFNNASPEETLEALRSGLIGEAEPMRRFGVLLSETRVKAEAYASGIAKAGDELTEQQKVQARYALILKDSNQAQGDFAKTSGGLANQSRILKAQLSDIGAEIGARLLPFLTRGARRVNEFLKQMQDGTGAGGEFLDTMKEIGATIEDVAGFIKDHAGLIKLAAGAWVGYKVAALAAASASKIAAAGAAAGGLGSAAKKGAGSALGRIGKSLPFIATGAAIASELGDSDDGAITVEGAKKQIDDLVASSSGLTDARRKLAEFAADFRQIANMPGKPDKWREFYGQIAEMAEDTGDKMAGAIEGSVGEMRRSFNNLKRYTTADMGDIREVVTRNTRRIRERLGEDSEEGRKAMSENFRSAADAVRRQMRRGEISTRDGMRAIRGFLAEELQLYGLSIQQARNVAKGQSGGGQYGDPDANRGREGGAFRQRGGWLGAKGMVGSDTIEVAPGYWAAPGEYYAKGPGGHGAVINRHQAPIVDLALMRGGHTLDSLPRDDSALPRIEAALRDFGGLNAVFSAVRRPHMLQQGGIVSVPGFPGERANRSILDEIAWVTKKFGLTLTDAFGPGHKSPGHTVTGTAADFAGPDAAMDAAVRALVRMGYLVGYDGRFGSQAWPGHGPTSVAGSNAHIHVEFGTKGGTAPSAAAKVPRQRIAGGGAVGAVVQSALDLARSGAQKLLDAGSIGALSTPTGGGGTGGMSKRAIAALWRRMNPGFGDPNLMAAIALAESGGRPGVTGPPDGRGLYQIEWPIWSSTLGKLGNPFNPAANTRMAGEVLKRQGLGAWVVYNTGAYRQYLQRGGQFAAGSGKAPGKGKAKPRRARGKPIPRGLPLYVRNLIGFAEGFEQQAELAQLTSGTDDDLYWLRALESTYSQIIKRSPAATASEYVSSLISTREQIAEILNPQVPGSALATETTRAPTEEEIAQGVAAQLSAFNTARRSLFSAYGSNYTLAGQPLVANQAAGLMHFGAGTGGAQAAPSTKVINQTNIFPTPPPEPHLFARGTLYDLQAAP